MRFHFPQPDPNGLVRVYVPQTLKQASHRKGRAKQIERFREAEITLEEIRETPEKYLMVFRASMLDDFERQFPDRTACLYSRWNGYLEQPDWKSTQQILANSNGCLHDVHTSGHMLSKDIVSFVNELGPKTIIPVHTFEPGHFKNHFNNVTQLQDGEPCQVE